MKSPQRINLYHPDLHPPRRGWGLAAPLLVVGVFLLLGGVTVWMQEDLAQRQKRLDEGLQKEKEVVLKLDALNRSRSGISHDLEEKHSVSALVSTLDQFRSHHGTGFSPLLTGLGDAKMPGVWLTRIRLSQGGASLVLDGESLDATLLPDYLRRLLSRPILAGRSFQPIVVDQQPQAGPASAFHLTSTHRGRGKTHSASTAVGGAP